MEYPELKEYPEWARPYLDKVLGYLVERNGHNNPKYSEQQNYERSKQYAEYIEEFQTVDVGNCIRWLNRALKYLNNTCDDFAIHINGLRVLYVWEPDEREKKLEYFGGIAYAIVLDNSFESGISAQRCKMLHGEYGWGLVLNESIPFLHLSKKVGLL